MISPNNLLILKKYKDSRYSYYTTDRILKKFIVDLGMRYRRNIDDNNYKRLFVLIFVNNILKYIYHA